ncbi:uncharacterized protein HKW66_Vig0181030 [Vigna angularis]|uniref:Uncharacterized protein n=1 Tax=Phaseolus angularis TaxID=3914 RepID=A0A8T0K5N3_PHAAN|nr:uncharacterized protein HKW66_Vig0181030 [Vigna angularis]
MLDRDVEDDFNVAQDGCPRQRESNTNGPVEGKANIFEGTIDNVTALSDMSFTKDFLAARQMEADFPV